MTVCLENVLEPEPRLLTAIMGAVCDPRLRICLDLGHANTCASHFPRKTGCAPARRICLMCICTTIRAAMICMRRFLTA